MSHYPLAGIFQHAVMKGFPNQVADLGKLATGMECLGRLVDGGANPKDDGIFGQALVRAGVAGTGHIRMPVEEYIGQQLRNTPSNQSFRTTARGLRELYRLLGFIDDSSAEIRISALGRRAASFAGSPQDSEQVRFWRRAIGNITHDGGDGETSHPYQVLLRLVGRKPGITRALCALALEAKNDSSEELERILALSELPETDIRATIGVSKPNWDNAKKVLPKFAEQLGDVVRTEHSFVLAVAPGQAEITRGTGEPSESARRGRPARPTVPRTSRPVTPETIGRAGTAETFDEMEVPVPGWDPKAALQGAISLRDRLRRHNLLVRELALRFERAGARLYEDPFDILALLGDLGILVEVKTLDGTERDERERARDALAQLLYYEAFVAGSVAGETAVRKVALFETAISEPHREWLNRHGIAVIWKVGSEIAGDKLATEFMGDHLGNLN